MLHITIVCGTRPEAIKLVPVYFELKKIAGVEVKFVSTGQHTTMLTQVLRFFGVKPDAQLKVMKPNQTLSGLTATLTQQMDRYLIENRNSCDAIVVQGDTTTAFVASLIGFYHKKKVIHVEAGLRTADKFNPFPEEVNRRLISRVADLHFAPTDASYDELLKEGCTNVYRVGNTVIDSLLMCVEKIKRKTKSYNKKYNFLDGYKKQILITCHRRETFGGPLLQICAAIKELAALYPGFAFVYPVHFNPNVRNVVFEELSNLKNVFLIDPVSYDEMVYLLKNAYLILTDSGGIQEEAPSLHKPLIILREETERMEGVTAGCALLAGIQKEAILSAARSVIEDEKVYHAMTSVPNPYGDGHAAEYIAKQIDQMNREGFFHAEKNG